MKKSSFTKKEHLKKNSLIRHVFDKGLACRGRLINTYLVKRDAPSQTNRAAFIIRKSLYNKKTVLRNRFRRVLREAYRNTKYLLSPGHDIVILATRLKKDTNPKVVEKELADVFKGRIKK